MISPDPMIENHPLLNRDYKRDPVIFRSSKGVGFINHGLKLPIQLWHKVLKIDLNMRFKFWVVPKIRVSFWYPIYWCRNIIYNQKGLQGLQ